jgi:fimbrial chaperone protein
MISKCWIARLASGFVTALLLISAAQAYEVRPIRALLDLNRGEMASTLSVTNTRETDLPVEVRVYLRTFDEDGAATLEEADDDWIVFPPQALIASGASQGVRFQYVGDIEIAESRNYVVQIEEVPATPEGFSGLIFAYNVGASVHLRAQGSTHQVSLEGYELDDEHLVLELRNAGNDYSRLSDHTLVVTHAGGRLTLSGADLNAVLDNPVLPPNALRRIRISLEALESVEGQISHVALPR